jgi:catechol 2,3-dioxygenase-like lactoylglutathione lyase family enzyme
MATPAPDLTRPKTPMLGHLGINVPDLEAARAYYDRFLPVLGFEPFLAEEDQFAYRPVAAKPGTYLFFYPATEVGYERDAPGLQHLAFMVPTRSDVRAAHQMVLDIGGDGLHPPRTFPEYPPPYYATFWLDPMGLTLEAVCHHDRD